jgi:putative aminopeptidase FrvX
MLAVHMDGIGMVIAKISGELLYFAPIGDLIQEFCQDNLSTFTVKKEIFQESLFSLLRICF